MMIAVLAGGRSSRMGRDKAAIPVGGVPMLERLCGEAVKVGIPVLVVGRTREELGFSMAGVEAIADDYPGQGPLAGLLTALEWLGGKSDVLLCACDLPRVEAGVFEWVGREWRGTGGQAMGPLVDEVANDREVPWALVPWALVPVLDGRDQPLFAFYSGRCVGPVRELVEAGGRSMMGLLERVPAQRVDVPPELRRLLVDVDTPEELDGIGSGGGKPLRK